MSRLAELIDQKVRESARQELELAEIESNSRYGVYRDRDCIEAIRKLINNFDAQTVGSRKVIKMIREACRAHGRFLSRSTKARSEARKAGLIP